MADLNLALFEVQIIWQEQLAQQFRHRSISIYMAKVQIRRLIGCLPLTLLLTVVFSPLNLVSLITNTFVTD